MAGIVRGAEEQLPCWRLRAVGRLGPIAFLHSCAAAKVLPGLLGLQKLSTLLPFLHVVAAEKLNGQLLPQLGTAATVAGLGLRCGPGARFVLASALP